MSADNLNPAEGVQGGGHPGDVMRDYCRKGDLIIPDGLATMVDPVLVVQSLGEAVALWDLGLTAVGLLSADPQALDRLGDLLKGRDVVILGTRDGPSDN